jgi:hypothetical protein
MTKHVSDALHLDWAAFQFRSVSWQSVGSPCPVWVLGDVSMFGSTLSEVTAKAKE